MNNVKVGQKLYSLNYELDYYVTEHTISKVGHKYVYIDDGNIRFEISDNYDGKKSIWYPSNFFLSKEEADKMCEIKNLHEKLSYKKIHQIENVELLKAIAKEFEVKI